MPDTQLLTLTIQPNDESADNGSVTPDGALVSLQLNRGISTTIPNYRIVLCARAADGSLAPVSNIGQGAYPSSQDPNGPPPLFGLGLPAQLRGHIAVVMADGVALPPNAVGQIDLVVDLLQPTAAGALRRVTWSAISTQAIQVSGGRFEITFI